MSLPPSVCATRAARSPMLSMLRGPAGVVQPSVDLAVGEVDRDDRRLEVGGDERERGATAAPGEGGRERWRARAERRRLRGARDGPCRLYVRRARGGPRDPERRERRRGGDTADKEADHAQAVRIRTRSARARHGRRPGRGRRPCAGSDAGWDGAVERRPAASATSRCPSGRHTIVAAVRTSDGRMLRYSTIHGVFGVPIVAYDGTTEGVSRDGTHARPRRVRREQQQTRFAVLGTSTAAAAAARDPAWPLVLRRAVARRPDPLRDPVPRHGPNPRYSVRAVSLVTREAGRRAARRQARAGRGDERITVGTRAQRERRLGVHALREAERHRLRPRARHRRAAGVLRRSAVADERAAPRRRASVARRTAAARSSSRSRVGTRLAVVDTTTFKVTAFAKP